MKTVLIVILFFVAAISFGMRHNIHYLSGFEDSLFKDPIQTGLIESSNPPPATVEGKSYTIVPKYHYEIHELVTSLAHYETKTQPLGTDVCGIWGRNLQNEAYRHTQFMQSNHFCLYSFSGSGFNENQASNSHLLFANQEAEDDMSSVHVGDAIKITGRLVDVTNGSIVWPTSVTRTDTGAGACEIILVDKVEKLTQPRSVMNVVFLISLAAIAVLTVGPFVYRRLALASKS